VCIAPPEGLKSSILPFQMNAFLRAKGLEEAIKMLSCKAKDP